MQLFPSPKCQVFMLAVKDSGLSGVSASRTTRTDQGKDTQRQLVKSDLTWITLRRTEASQLSYARNPPNRRRASRSSRARGCGNPEHISTTPTTAQIVQPFSNTLKALRGRLPREPAGLSSTAVRLTAVGRFADPAWQQPMRPYLLVTAKFCQ